MASLTADQIAAGLARSGFQVGPDEAAKLEAFIALLLHWNRVHNLTGISDPHQLIERHLAESLALETYLGGDDVADIGSGAGIPGIPLAIRRPETRFTLIESRRKRVSFLRQAAVELALANVSVAHARAESLEPGSFTTVVARAVAEPARLLEIAVPLVGAGGRLVLLTSAEKADALIRLATGFSAVDPGRAALPAALRLPSRIVVLERGLS